MNSRNQVGPYRIRRRYRDTGRETGRVYEAVHAETGRSAVLVSPGPAEEWKPGAEWRVYAAAGLNPPHLSIEVERAPGGATTRDVEELTLMLGRLARVVSRLEGRPDAAAHLGGQVAHRQLRPRRVRWLLMSGNLAAILLVLLWPREVSESAVVGGPDELVPVSGAVDTGGIIGRDMPKQPFPGQKRAPCTPRSQVELNGVCWIEMAAKAPCPEDVVEHGAKCYVPVFTPPPVPASILR
ncbi:hypothetical protein [Archangium violaceum]|uniref:hypothetical protein n=1 Tax=Archangium violaceum TaxID=83451 RepID=UPI0036DC8146